MRAPGMCGTYRRFINRSSQPTRLFLRDSCSIHIVVYRSVCVLRYTSTQLPCRVYSFLSTRLRLLHIFKFGPLLFGQSVSQSLAITQSRSRLHLWQPIPTCPRACRLPSADPTSICLQAVSIQGHLYDYYCHSVHVFMLDRHRVHFTTNSSTITIIKPGV